MTDSTPDPRLMSAHVVSSDGDRIGKVAAVLLDAGLRTPEFLEVRRSMLGIPNCFVPIAGYRFDENDDAVVPFDHDTIDAAPRPDLHGGTFDEAQSRQLHDHYGTNDPSLPPPTTREGS